MLQTSLDQVCVTTWSEWKLLLCLHFIFTHVTSNWNIHPLYLLAFIKAEMGRSAGGHSSSLTAGERTPTRPKASDRITLGSHGNSAFQPITASCKIVPQGQPPSPAESPGKSFQPITMSCKIVSGKCLHLVATLKFLGICCTSWEGARLLMSCFRRTFTPE